MPQDFAHKELLPSIVANKTEHTQASVKYIRRETDLPLDIKQAAPARIAFQGRIVSNILFDYCIQRYLILVM